MAPSERSARAGLQVALESDRCFLSIELDDDVSMPSSHLGRVHAARTIVGKKSSGYV
jgi:hypothetical protein